MILPKFRRPTTPGDMIVHEFLSPLRITQAQLADAMQISRVRVNALLNGRRGVTPDTARRLERVFGMSAAFWLRLQISVDLWDAEHAENAADLKGLRKLVS